MESRPVYLTLIALGLLLKSDSVYASPKALRSALQKRCAQYLQHEKLGEVPNLDLARVKKIEISEGFDVDVHEVSGRSGSGDAWPEVERVIEFANRQFERRDWPTSFLEGRFEAALKSLPQSDYVYTTKSGTEEITGSLGMTVARTDAHELLTMEKTHPWSLERPKTKGPCSKIIELRTYGLNTNLHTKWEQNRPYAFLWERMRKFLQAELAECPELLSSKIIYSYGDATSIRMYRKMGFEVADPKLYPPFTDKKTTWQVLISSPEKVLQNFLERIQVPRKVETETDFVQIRNGDGKKFVADTRARRLPDGKIEAGKIEFTEGNHVGYRLAEEAEVAPGVWAAEGSKVYFYDNGNLAYVDQLARRVEPVPGLFVDAGSTLSFHRNGHFYFTRTLAKPYPVPGIEFVARQGELIQFTSDGHFYGASSEFSDPVFPQQYPNLLTKVDGQIAWNFEKRTVWFALDEKSKLPKGVFVPNEAFDLHANFDLKGNNPKLQSIRYTVPHSVVLPNGLHVPEGSEITYTFENGIPSVTHEIKAEG